MPGEIGHDDSEVLSQIIKEGIPIMASAAATMNQYDWWPVATDAI